MLPEILGRNEKKLNLYNPPQTSFFNHKNFSRVPNFLGSTKKIQPF
jgi:hypothetical protein